MFGMRASLLHVPPHLFPKENVSNRDFIEGLRNFMKVRSDGGDDRAAFAELESISIDYAIAEHARDVQVVPVDCGWSDVGSFATL